MVCYNICEARTVGRDKPGRCRVEDLSHQRLARQCLVEWGSGPGEKAPHHTVPAAQTFTARSGGPVESGAGLSAPRALCLSCLGFLSDKQNSKRSDGRLACLPQGCTKELRSPGLRVRVHCTSPRGSWVRWDIRTPKAEHPSPPFPVCTVQMCSQWFPGVGQHYTSWSRGCG